MLYVKPSITNTIMTLKQAQTLALELMTEHGLSQNGWRFKFDNARRRAGVCKYRSRVVGLSKYLVPHMKDEKVIDTILHEIAHALVGSGHGHDRVWQRKAIEIGCNGNRCYNPQTEFNAGAVEELAIQSKYSLTCPTCGKKTAVHRKPKRSKSCGKCCSVYNPKHKLILEQNY